MTELIPAAAYEALSQRLVEVTAERDRARGLAVALEGQLARVEALAEFRDADQLIHEFLNPEATS